ncbi:MAG: hypothetical protein AAF544_00050 [Bacteroidota bacterium]
MRALAIFLFLTLFFACDREESLIYQEIELPRDVVIVEEEGTDFLVHRLGDLVAEGTSGSAYYSDDFGWFYLGSLIWNEFDCTVNESNFSFSGSGSPVGGNSSLYFDFFGRHDGTDAPFPVVISYYTTGSGGQFARYNSGFCGTSTDVVIENVTPDRVEGRFYGTVARIPDSGPFDCEDPDLEILPVDATFSLPRLITDCN